MRTAMLRTSATGGMSPYSARHARSKATDSIGNLVRARRGEAAGFVTCDESASFVIYENFPPIFFHSVATGRESGAQSHGTSSVFATHNITIRPKHTTQKVDEESGATKRPSTTKKWSITDAHRQFK